MRKSIIESLLPIQCPAMLISESVRDVALQ